MIIIFSSVIIKIYDFFKNWQNATTPSVTFNGSDTTHTYFVTILPPISF
jgi:hypothetical protein